MKKNPVGRTEAEMGLKPQLSPKDHVTKEEELGNLFYGCVNAKLPPLAEGFKIQPLKKTSKGQALLKLGQVRQAAVVDFMGIYTCERWARPKSDLPP